MNSLDLARYQIKPEYILNFFNMTCTIHIRIPQTRPLRDHGICLQG